MSRLLGAPWAIGRTSLEWAGQSTKSTAEVAPSNTQSLCGVRIPRPSRVPVFVGTGQVLERKAKFHHVP